MAFPRLIRFVRGPLVAACLTMPSWLQCQSDGNEWTIVAGAALGAYSGGILGTVGGVMPCGYALNPSSCSLTWTLVGAGIGGVSGGHIGSVSRERMGDLATSAAIGFGVGTAVGVVLAPFVHHYTWQDALAIGMIGGAIGASPKGAAIGLAAGLAGGVLLWRVIPTATSEDALQTALLGLAVGGISGWMAEALQVGGNGAVVFPMSVAF
jgi:hypothetical protein